MVELFTCNEGVGGSSPSVGSMAKEEEMVSIPRSRYEYLEKRDAWLECLEWAGVDNWSGWDIAIDLRCEHYKELFKDRCNDDDNEDDEE